MDITKQNKLFEGEEAVARSARPTFPLTTNTNNHDNTPRNIPSTPSVHTPPNYPITYTPYFAPPPPPYHPPTAPPLFLQHNSYSMPQQHHPHLYPPPQFGSAPHYHPNSNNNLYYAADELLRPEVEETFCNNFVCCGQYLADLHALLQHYEEAHIQLEDNTLKKKRNRLEDVAADSLLEVGGAATVTTTTTSNNIPNAIAHPTSTTKITDNTGHSSMHHHNQLLQHNPHYSAFDTTLIRKTADSGYEYLPITNSTMHRPMSVPAYPHTTTKQYNTFNNQYSHQYGSRMQALTADKNNLQLLCSILNNSFDPILNAPPPPPPPPSSNTVVQLITTTTTTTTTSGTPSSTTDAKATNTKRHRLGTKHPTAKMIAFSSITVNNRPAIIDRSSSRPYRCPLSSCGKSYKNPNGLKYHAAHGHAVSEVTVERPFGCTVQGCGKKYKNANGLKYHSVHAHDPYNSRSKNMGDMTITKKTKKTKTKTDNEKSDTDSEYSKSSHAEFLSDGPVSGDSP